MGILENIQTLINEFGSSSILRERLSLLKDQIVKLEKQNKELKDALSDIQIENTKLRKQISEQSNSEQFVECRGGLFKRKPSGGFHKAVYCPKCKSPMSSLQGEIPYSCNRCYINLDFAGDQLAKVMKELIEENP
jgi:hypothetical protein